MAIGLRERPNSGSPPEATIAVDLDIGDSTKG
jgi:hypothetical protein